MLKNEKGLVYLDDKMMNALFDCVYGLDGCSSSQTKEFLKEDWFKDFIRMLFTMQEFNYRYRYEQISGLFPLFEETVGPMEVNSDGTALWLALGLAIKELYGFRKKTLKDLLEKVKVKK
ncbi:hypothetical protein [Siminovitchia fortis]|uniref:hypothetical protein n=1 Tax=Siminovitchia fortis TaxID=254758 RepID=UPI0011A1E125|nr:hypothetical protein [Siminovitchia fortis]